MSIIGFLSVKLKIQLSYRMKRAQDSSSREILIQIKQTLLQLRLTLTWQVIRTGNYVLLLTNQSAPISEFQRPLRY